MAGWSSLFGDNNALSVWADSNRSMLGAIGGGLGSGVTFGEGLGNAAQLMGPARQADDAYALALKEKAASEAKATQTMEFLRTNAPKYFEAVNAGAMQPGEAWAMAMQDMQPKAPIKGSAGDVWLDPTTYQPIASVPDPKAQAEADQQMFSREKDLAAQYSGQDPVKTYQLVKGGYERVRQSAAADTGAGDVGLVYGFMKMLDPGSVVREGEFATAESTAGIPQQIVGLYNKALSGQRLTPEQRQQFVALADQLYQESASNLSDTNAQFGNRAKPWGVDASRFAVQPETFQPMQAPTPSQNWVDAGGGYKVRPM